MMSSSIWLDRVNQVEMGAQTFLDIYYKSFDNKDQYRRKNLQKLYMPEAVLNFRGHTYKKPENIGNFQDSLPETEHRIDGLDCQPVSGNEGDKPIDHQHSPLVCLVNVSGTVGYKKLVSAASS